MKNFIIRTLTGIAIVAIQVLCTYLSPLSLAGLFLLLTALTVNEFLGILAQKGEVKVNRSIVVFLFFVLFFIFPIKIELIKKTIVHVTTSSLRFD